MNINKENHSPERSRLSQLREKIKNLDLSWFECDEESKKNYIPEKLTLSQLSKKS